MVFQEILDQFDWEKLRAHGDAAKIPAGLIALSSAAAHENAVTAWRDLFHIFTFNNQLYEAGKPVLHCLIAMLPHCPSYCIDPILDLMTLVCASEPAPAEIAAGNDQLANECRHLVSEYIGVILAACEKTLPESLDLYGDLVEFACETDPSRSQLCMDHIKRMQSLFACQPEADQIHQIRLRLSQIGNTR